MIGGCGQPSFMAFRPQRFFQFMLFQQLNTRAVHALDGFIQLKLLPKVLGPCGGITQCRHVHPLNSSCARCQLSSLRSLEYFLRGRNHSKELSAGLAPPARNTADFLNPHASANAFVHTALSRVYKFLPTGCKWQFISAFHPQTLRWQSWWSECLPFPGGAPGEQ